MEALTIASPLQPATIFTVCRLVYDWENAFVEAVIKDQFEHRWIFYRNGAVATALLNITNKANHSVKTIHRATIEYLQSQGDLPAGTFSGSPD